MERDSFSQYYVQSLVLLELDFSVQFNVVLVVVTQGQKSR